MNTRRILKLVRPHERQMLRRWLVWCLLIAAAANVPFAVSRAELPNTSSPAGATSRTGNDIPAVWPTVTPHAEPWPVPTSWREAKSFGKWYFDVRSKNPDPKTNGFAMSLRRSGWPLPVLEHKMMWWNWDNPALTLPDGNYSDPPMQLMPLGLILNPIIVGSSTWALMVAVFFLTVIRRRAKRLRRGQCLKCGYDLAGLQPNAQRTHIICPECGSPHHERPSS